MSFLAAGALSGFIAVALGAFGAHALKRRLSDERRATFEIAVRYQMYHALAMALVGLAHASPARDAAGWLFLGGSAVFSGTVYALALGGPRWLGAVTPLGGLAFLGGWAALAWSALR